MVDYTQYKVNELKDILRKRSLPLSGTKSELIKCLQENDALASNENAEEEPVAEEESKEEPEAPRDEPASKSTEEEPAQSTEASAEETKSNDSQEKASEDAPKPTEPVLTDDEFLAQFTNDLEKQIKRAKRFGTDATELEARLKRVQKFGISAVRDAASKADDGSQKRRNLHRKGGKKLRRGPKPATA